MAIARWGCPTLCGHNHCELLQRTMSAVPELKQKKIARDQELAKAAKDAAAKSAAEHAEHVKAITAKAAQYEKEYAAVRNLSFLC